MEPHILIHAIIVNLLQDKEDADDLAGRRLLPPFWRETALKPRETPSLTEQTRAKTTNT